MAGFSTRWTVDVIVEPRSYTGLYPAQPWCGTAGEMGAGVRTGDESGEAAGENEWLRLQATGGNGNAHGSHRAGITTAPNPRARPLSNAAVAAQAPSAAMAMAVGASPLLHALPSPNSSPGICSCSQSTFQFTLVKLPPHRSLTKSCGAARGARAMAPDEEKMTRRSPLDFPIEWDRPRPGRRADIFPQFSPMKTPLPPPLPADPPEEDEDEEEKKEGEEEENSDEPEKPDVSF